MSTTESYLKQVVLGNNFPLIPSKTATLVGKIMYVSIGIPQCWKINYGHKTVRMSFVLSFPFVFILCFWGFLHFMWYIHKNLPDILLTEFIKMYTSVFKYIQGTA